MLLFILVIEAHTVIVSDTVDLSLSPCLLYLEGGGGGGGGAGGGGGGPSGGGGGGGGAVDLN